MPDDGPAGGRLVLRLDRETAFMCGGLAAALLVVAAACGLQGLDRARAAAWEEAGARGEPPEPLPMIEHLPRIPGGPSTPFQCAGSALLAAWVVTLCVATLEVDPGSTRLLLRRGLGLSLRRGVIPLAGAQRLILREEPWTKATRRTRSRHCLLLLEGPSGRAPVWRFADRPTADRFVARLAPRLRLEVSEERGSLTDTACQSQGSEPGG